MRAQYGAETDGYILSGKGVSPGEGTYTQPEHGLKLAVSKVFNSIITRPRRDLTGCSHLYHLVT